MFTFRKEAIFYRFEGGKRESFSAKNSTKIIVL